MKILFSMILLSLLTFTVRAQSHTIRLVTPWAVGGSTDIVTRQLAEGLVARRMSREELKTNVESNIRIWKIVLGKELVN